MIYLMTAVVHGFIKTPQDDIQLAQAERSECVRAPGTFPYPL